MFSRNFCKILGVSFCSIRILKFIIYHFCLCYSVVHVKWIAVALLLASFISVCLFLSLCFYFSFPPLCRFCLYLENITSLFYVFVIFVLFFLSIIWLNYHVLFCLLCPSLKLIFYEILYRFLSDYHIILLLLFFCFCSCVFFLYFCHFICFSVSISILVTCLSISVVVSITLIVSLFLSMSLCVC